MLEALQQALEALKAHEDKATQEWQIAHDMFESAKRAEYDARCLMQDTSETAAKLEEYIAALKLGGKP